MNNKTISCQNCQKECIKIYKNQKYCSDYCGSLGEKNLKKIRNKQEKNKNRRFGYRKKYLEELLKKYDNKCCVCSSMENLTIDHIKPQMIGGKHTIDNLRILCRTCNIKEFHKLVNKALTLYFKNN